MKTWVRRLVVSILVAGLVIGIGGSSLAQARNYTVYVVVHGGIADPFWKVCERGAKDAAALYPDLDVTYVGPAVYKFEEFMTYVESAIAYNPDALVVTLTDPTALDEPLRAAIAAGLTVVAINAPDLREPVEARIPVLTYVGEDSYVIGVTAAEETLKRFTPKRAVFANHHPGAVNIEARGRGWIDTMKAKGIPTEQLDITEDAIKGAEIMAAYLRANPDTDAVFISNILRTETIIPRLEADDIKVGVDVKIAQMDISPKILEYIGAGKVMFTMDQQQYLQGYLGVLFAYLQVKYGFTPPPAPVSTGPAVVTKADISGLTTLSEQGYR